MVPDGSIAVTLAVAVVPDSAFQVTSATCFSLSLVASASAKSALTCILDRSAISMKPDDEDDEDDEELLPPELPPPELPDDDEPEAELPMVPLTAVTVCCPPAVRTAAVGTRRTSVTSATVTTAVTVCPIRAPAGTESRLSTTATAKVTAIDPSATTSNSVVTYGVTLILDKVPTGAKVGQTVSVSVTTGSVENAVYVNSAAITTVGTRHTVTVVSNGTQETRQVEIGLEGDEATQITSGVTAGEQVVLKTTSTSTSNSNQNGGGFGGLTGGGAPGGGAPGGNFGGGGR